MSIRRVQGRTVNRNTYLDNRLTTFTNTPMTSGDLHVERDQTIGGNTTVSGTVVVLGTADSTSTSTGSLLVAGGIGIAGNLFVGGTIYGNFSEITLSSEQPIVANSTENASSINEGSLQVRGGVGIVKDVYVGGGIDVFGSANFKTIPTSINPTLDNSSNQLATTAFVKTNINTLIGGAGPLFDTLKEIQTALNDDPNFNVTINNLVSSNNALAVHLAGDETITGSKTFNADVSMNTNLRVGANSNVASTSTDTGSLIVKGGVGISGNAFVGSNTNVSGNVVVNSITASTSTSTGALQVSGGAGIGGNLFVGGNSNVTGSITTGLHIINSTVVSTSTSTGALQVSGGAGIGGNLFVGGNSNVTGSITTGLHIINSTVVSTSTSTGALQVSGGAGIGGNLFVGGNSTVSGKVGLGIAASTIYELDISGQVRIFEVVGSDVSSNFSNGSLTLEHADGSGCSSIMFKGPNTATNSDYAYIKYQDNESSGLNSGNRGLLTIGIENDASSNPVINDSISLYAAGGLGYVGVNTKAPTAALDVVGDLKVNGLSSLKDVRIHNGLISGIRKQLGQDLSGIINFQKAGDSVALSSTGTILAVGSNGFNSDQGLVQIYSFDGSVWSQLGADLSGATSSQAGFSLALSSSGTTVAIGSPFFDGALSNIGRVQVFNYNGSVWTQVGTDLSGSNENENAGYSVDISTDGTIVAVGSAFNGTSNNGRVRVYSYSGSTWNKLGADLITTGSQTVVSCKLSANGQIIAVGSQGSTKIYSYSNNSWIQVGLTLPGSHEGLSLSSSGNIVGIGNFVSNAVRIYAIINNVWTQMGSTINGDSGEQFFGYSISLSSTGTTLAIGSYAYAAYKGRLQVYDWTGSSWIQRGLTFIGSAAGDALGISCALSSDGTIIAIGSSGFAPVGTQFRGKAQVYDVGSLSISSFRYIGINNPNPLYTLDVSGNINASGTVRASGTVLTSDYRIKEFVSPLDQSFNVDILNPVSYYLNGDNSRLQIGFIAHEVQEIYPFLVNGVKDGPEIQSINYNGFIGILTKEIQVLKKKDEENRAKIVAQEVRIQRLEEAVADLLKP